MPENYWFVMGQRRGSAERFSTLSTRFIILLYIEVQGEGGDKLVRI